MRSSRNNTHEAVRPGRHFGARRAASRSRGQVVGIVLIVLGALMLSYPLVADLLSRFSQTEAVTSYSDAADGLSAQQLADAMEAARVYNENLAGDPVHDPFVAGSGYALPTNYESVLNLGGDGVMGYLEIPKINVKLPIYHGTSAEVLERGVGHIAQTALPIGGKGNRSFLTGHRGLPAAELFTRLDELKDGDLIYVHVLEETLCYKVSGKEVVDPDETEGLVADPDRDMVTLVTCTPYGVNTQRLLVDCDRTDYVPPEEAGESATPSWWGLRPVLAGVAVGLLALLVLKRVLKRRG